MPFQLNARFRALIAHSTNRFWSSETAVMTLLAVLVGAGTGLGVSLFRKVLDGLLTQTVEGIGAAVPLALIFLPIVGGLLTAFWMRYASRDGEIGLGVSGIMEAVGVHSGRIGWRGSLARIVGAILTVGLGGSAGPEDPSVQIGATLGSQLAQRLKLSSARIKTLVGCGAAAGLSAAFNAPITGVFFAIEIILGEFSGAAIGWVVLAAVAGAVVSQSLLGSAPAFVIPAYQLRTPAELALYLVLGVCAAVVASAYILILARIETWFEHVRVPTWLKPAVGGLGVGLLAYFGSTAIMGPGYQAIGSVLRGGEFSAGFLLLLVALKLVATPLTLGSGGQGGLFAPSLFLGAMLGAAFGTLGQTLFGNSIAPAPAYGLVGMGAVLAGAVRAPITGLMLPFEMTQDYRIILPLMLAVVVSTLIAGRITHESVYTLKLKQRGVELGLKRTANLMGDILVGDAMTPVNELTPLRAGDSLSVLTRAFEITNHHGFLVLNDAGELYGIVTLSDLETALARGGQVKTVGEICSTGVTTAFPDETLEDALQHFGVLGVGRIPVVDRRDPRRVLGLLRRADIIQAYSHALLKKQQREHHHDRLRLEAAAHTEMLEVSITADNAAAGKRIQELQLPEECVIVAVRRGERTLVPRGKTLILPGDQLIAVSTPAMREPLVQVLKGQDTNSE
jgi:CIC family chloride channel protein